MTNRRNTKLLWTRNRHFILKMKNKEDQLIL